jgi:hypothetical protein
MNYTLTLHGITWTDGTLTHDLDDAALPAARAAALAEIDARLAAAAPGAERVAPLAAARAAVAHLRTQAEAAALASQVVVLTLRAAPAYPAAARVLLGPGAQRVDCWHLEDGHWTSHSQVFAAGGWIASGCRVPATDPAVASEFARAQERARAMLAADAAEEAERAAARAADAAAAEQRSAAAAAAAVAARARFREWIVAQGDDYAMTLRKYDADHDVHGEVYRRLRAAAVARIEGAGLDLRVIAAASDGSFMVGFDWKPRRSPSDRAFVLSEVLVRQGLADYAAPKWATWDETTDDGEVTPERQAEIIGVFISCPWDTANETYICLELTHDDFPDNIE